MPRIPVIDIHMHIQPWKQFKPEALALMQRDPQHFQFMTRLCDDPHAFLEYLDQEGVQVAGLVNYVAPQVMGFQDSVCEFVVEYCKADPKRLIPIGSLHPQFSPNVSRRMDQLARMGIRILKIHPPHQCIYPNAHRSGDQNLQTIYEKAQEYGIPVMIHTGTSIFPGARNVYADPIYVDDVAVDFPRLQILLAHGGRPLWMETAFFLVRRHPNVYLDVSGIPPKSLLKYFPRLEEIAAKTLFGTDWPGPGVPDIKQNLEQFRALPLAPAAQEQILSQTALTIWPA